MPNIDLSILNQRQTPAFYADVFANRPAAGYVGRIFVSTDTYAFYRDNGTGWDLIGGPGTGTITGSGTTNTVAKFTGSAILGDSSITDNGTEVSMKLLKLDTTSFGSSTINFGQASSLNAVGTGYSALGAIGTTGMMFYIPQATTNRSFIFDISSIPDATTRTYNVPSSSGTLALTSNIPSVSGTAGQIAYFNGSTSITGDNGLYYDSVNDRIGIGTITPGAAIDAHSSANIIAQLNQTTATNNSLLAFQNSGAGLWRIGNFYNGGANDLGIFDVIGNIQPVTVKKTSGQVLIGTSTVGSGKLVVASATGDNGIQIVGATAPSLRIDSAESGPTKRAGLGISTATNNFIQGSADRDFCIFNGSTAVESPILFGIYAIGAGNVQEAARISAARNFLIGTTTDSGEKLIVNGAAKITGVSYFNRGTLAFTLNPSYGGFNVYSQLQSTGDLALATGGDSNKVYITTGGSWGVGIGNSTPAYKLDVTGVVASNTGFLISSGQYSNITEVPYTGIYMTNSSSPDGFGSLLISSRTDAARPIIFGTSSGSASAERMRIAASTGNLLIGTTTDNGAKLQVNGTSYFSNNVLIGQSTSSLSTNGWNLSEVGGGHTVFSINNNEAFIFNNLNTGTSYQIDFRTNSIERGNITVTDTGTTYNTISDYRLKEDFRELNGLDKISKIKIYDFKFKDFDIRTDGVIAHELQEVLPYAVTGEKDGNKYQLVDYSKIVPVLVKAIQELNTKIENLK